MDFAPVVSPEFAARQGDNNNDVNGIVPFVSPVLDSSSPDSSTSRSEDASNSDESYDSEGAYDNHDRYYFDVYNGGDGMTESTQELTPSSLLSSPFVVHSRSRVSNAAAAANAELPEFEQGGEERDNSNDDNNDDGILPRYIDVRANLFPMNDEEDARNEDQDEYDEYDDDESEYDSSVEDVCLDYMDNEDDHVHDFDAGNLVNGFFTWMSHVQHGNHEDDGLLDEWTQSAYRADVLSPAPGLVGASSSSSSDTSDESDSENVDASGLLDSLERVDLDGHYSRQLSGLAPMYERIEI